MYSYDDLFREQVRQTGSTFDFLKLSSGSNSGCSKKSVIYGDKKPIVNGPRCDVTLDDVDGNITSHPQRLWKTLTALS
ncbi:hypothetical protein BYT27DRAFT_7200752, partial [Phlegmacium glaucopus]